MPLDGVDDIAKAVKFGHEEGDPILKAIGDPDARGKIEDLTLIFLAAHGGSGAGENAVEPK